MKVDEIIRQMAVVPYFCWK